MRLKHLGWAACGVAAIVLLQASAQAQEATEAPAAVRRELDVLAAYDQGQKLLAEKKYKEAIGKFNEALQKDKTFPEAYVGKGDAQRELEDYQSALNTYSQALNYDANSAAAFTGRGECFLELMQIDVASNDFSNALELAPNDPRVLSNVGHILANYSRDIAALTTAIRRLDDAIAGNPEDARAYRDRGWAQTQIREFDKAEADIKKAAEIEPGDYENFYTLANVYLFQEKLEPAIDALTSAIEAYKPKKRGEPEVFAVGYLGRADARMRLAEKEKDAKKSEALLTAVIADANVVLDKFEGRPQEEGLAYFKKGRAERMLERYSDAVNSFNRAIRSVQPGQEASYIAEALMYRGICWYYMGEAELARGDFEQASASGTGYQDPRVFLWIGLTHHKEGDYRDAIKSYGEAIAKAPNFSLAHVNKGRAYMDLKEYKRAIESFNNAIRSEPDVGEYYYNVGFANMQLKQYQRAADFLRMALLQDNPQPKMYRLMATALRELGRGELADEYEKKADAAPVQAAGS